MYDDYINRFRRKVTVEDDVSAKMGDIIAQSLSKMSVILERLQKAIPVILINKDKEGGDESIMYSYVADGVQVGDYITAFDKSHLVYKEITNLKREDYIDCWRTVMCNIDFSFNNNTIKAYFRGPLRSVQNEEDNLALNFGVNSSGDSFIMIPSTIDLGLNTPIQIDGKGWRTKFVDKSTNRGVSYVALEEYNIVDLTKISIIEDPNYEAPVLTALISGLTYDFITEDGYISFNPNLEIVSRTKTLIKIKIPFNINVVSITIKKDGLLVSKSYTIGV